MALERKIMLGVSSPDPGKYGSLIRVMKAMHWSWSELMATPNDLVDEVLFRMDEENHWLNEKQRYQDQLGDVKGTQ